MKQAMFLLLLVLIAYSGYTQQVSNDSIKLSPNALYFTKITRTLARKYDFYANRKISYGFSESLYGFHTNTRLYHAIDAIFARRIGCLDLTDYTSFELIGGASFQPYQGFRLHIGFDYEWLTPTKVHLYAGLQFAEGLKQNTPASNGQSSVVVGYHSYLVPFAGMMYWPGKRDIKYIEQYDSSQKAKLKNPSFWQLVYIKTQVGYSALISKLSVYPSETFDKTTASDIRNNVSSGLYFSLGAGINLPTFKNTRMINLNLINVIEEMK
jgi:hypothetical protein